MKALEQRFATIKNGKVTAFAVHRYPSVIGVNLYQFLSNNRLGRNNQHEDRQS